MFSYHIKNENHRSLQGTRKVLEFEPSSDLSQDYMLLVSCITCIPYSEKNKSDTVVSYTLGDYQFVK
jgi:hypothetical protein